MTNNKQITFPATVCTNRIDFQEFSLVKQRKKKQKFSQDSEKNSKNLK